MRRMAKVKGRYSWKDLQRTGPFYFFMAHLQVAEYGFHFFVFCLDSACVLNSSSTSLMPFLSLFKLQAVTRTGRGAIYSRNPWCRVLLQRFGAAVGVVTAAAFLANNFASLKNAHCAIMFARKIFKLRVGGRGVARRDVLRLLFFTVSFFRSLRFFFVCSADDWMYTL